MNTLKRLNKNVYVVYKQIDINYIQNNYIYSGKAPAESWALIRRSVRPHFFSESNSRQLAHCVISRWPPWHQ